MKEEQRTDTVREVASEPQFKKLGRWFKQLDRFTKVYLVISLLIVAAVPSMIGQTTNFSSRAATNCNNNNICDAEESCSSCPNDCGSCQLSSACTNLKEKLNISFGSQCGGTNYNPLFDYDLNGKVELYDFVEFAAYANSAEWCEEQLNFASSNVIPTPCSDEGLSPACVSLKEMFVASFGANTEDDKYNPQFDYDSNGKVELYDFVEFAGHAGNTDWCEAQLNNKDCSCSKADLNQDNTVNYLDLGICGNQISCKTLINNWYGESCGDNSDCLQADLNKDGIVNYLDLGICGNQMSCETCIKNWYGKTCNEEACIAEGQSGAVIPDSPSCCEGLSNVASAEIDPSSGLCMHKDGAFLCTKCGDGTCGLGENECNCPKDCNNIVMCTAIYDPVCGVDGKTYSNECVAKEQEHVEVAYKGECSEEEPEDVIAGGCTVITSPTSQTLRKGKKGTVTAKVMTGAGPLSTTNLTVIEMKFGSYNTSVATVRPVSDSVPDYSTIVIPVKSGKTAIWATAYLSNGMVCQSTGDTDTDIKVTSGWWRW